MHGNGNVLFAESSPLINQAGGHFAATVVERDGFLPASLLDVMLDINKFSHGDSTVAEFRGLAWV